MQTIRGLAALLTTLVLAMLVAGQGGLRAQTAADPPLPGIAEPLRWNHVSLQAQIPGGCGELSLELVINPGTGRIETFSLLMEAKPVVVPAAAYKDLKYIQAEGLSVSIAGGGCGTGINGETVSIIFVYGIPYDSAPQAGSGDIEFMMAELIISERKKVRRHLTTVFRGGRMEEKVTEF
ncbi:MAG: hypothetical protein V3R73_01680 [Sphingomonadales bacterium]